MSKVPREVSGYVVLPTRFPALPSFPKTTMHYIYLRPHEPKLPNPDSPRSLFLVNIPITTTETHLRHLFGHQLGAGRVERVEFQDGAIHKREHPVAAQGVKSSKKRKRVTVEDLEAELDGFKLPEAWDRDLQMSGAHAVAVFVDRPSMEASLKAAKRVAKTRTEIVWGEGLSDDLPSLGSARYLAHQRLRYPPRKDLLQSVNSYMTAYARLEEARTRAEAQKRQVPDEDGFIMVTRGSRGGVARAEEAAELAEKQKEKSKGLEDFYRFQMREKRKEKQGELIRKFEEDRKKVEEMRKRRGRIMPE